MLAGEMTEDAVEPWAAAMRPAFRGAMEMDGEGGKVAWPII